MIAMESLGVMELSADRPLFGLRAPGIRCKFGARGGVGGTKIRLRRETQTALANLYVIFKVGPPR